MKTVTLYKTIGEKEMVLIAENNFKMFPHGLENEPVFYTFLNEEYATERALKFNTTNVSGNYLAFVTEFIITEEEYLKYDGESITSKVDSKLCVPIEYLERFNKAIIGKIKVINLFVGKNFKSFLNNNLIDFLDNEISIYEYRLENFLKTKSREIIPLDFFEEEIEHKEDMFRDNVEKHFSSLKEKVIKINTIEEAVSFLIECCLNEEELNKIRNETLVTQFGFNNNHFGINMYLRNLFFHGNKNEIFLNNIRNYNSYNLLSSGELGEGNLANALWRNLNDYEFINLENLEKIKSIELKMEELKSNLFKELGLVKEDHTKEKYYKILNEKYDEIKLKLNRLYEANSISEPFMKIQLLSYNLDETVIEEYIELKKVFKDKLEDSLSIEYKQKSILAGITKGEEPIYNKLKRDLFNIVKVVDKLINLKNG